MNGECDESMLNAVRRPRRLMNSLSCAIGCEWSSVQTMKSRGIGVDQNCGSSKGSSEGVNGSGVR